MSVTWFIWIMGRGILYRRSVSKQPKYSLSILEHLYVWRQNLKWLYDTKQRIKALYPSSFWMLVNILSKTGRVVNFRKKFRNGSEKAVTTCLSCVQDFYTVYVCIKISMMDMLTVLYRSHWLERKWGNGLKISHAETSHVNQERKNFSEDSIRNI